MKRCVSTLCVLALLTPGCTRPAPRPKAAPFQPSAIKVEIRSGGPVIFTTSSAEFQVQPSGYIQASLLLDKRRLSLDEPRLGAPTDSNYIVRDGKELHFTLAFDQARVLESVTQLGPGKRIEIPGRPLGPSGTAVEAELIVEVYDAFPNLLLSSVDYKNTGTDNLLIDQAVEQEHRFNAQLADPKVRPWDMWSFQGTSYGTDEDGVLHLSRTSAQPDDGSASGKAGSPGGIPVVAFWTGSVGEAIGHVERLPLTLSFPVKVAPDERIIARLNVPGGLIKPGEIHSTPLSFLAVYSGDFYEPLRMWSDVLQKEGWTRASPSPEAYNPGWSGSGYESSVSPGQMLAAIPRLKELGIKHAALEGRWFDAYGDWQPRPEIFPGEAMKRMTAEFHSQGLLLELGWLPLGAEDGPGTGASHKYIVSHIVQQHPEWLILDQKGNHARMSRDLAVLCPALPEVQAYYGQLVERFVRDWDMDGFFLDSIPRVPPCYNPAHHHASPQDSVNAVADLYRVICQTSRALKPQSLNQACPCTAPFSLAWLRFIDQVVAASDPDPAHLRRRIKIYKALFGPAAPVYADRTELPAMEGISDTRRESNLASTVGIGGVVGARFVWPESESTSHTVSPTFHKAEPEKKWIALYNQKMLSRGTFLDLYLYGYDVPEGYAIAKGGKMYYAFFTPGENASWKGQLELRGLKPGRYQVIEYERGRNYGVVEAGIGHTPRLAIGFTGHLLLEVGP